jgi:hypothetical protein
MLLHQGTGQGKEAMTEAAAQLQGVTWVACKRVEDLQQLVHGSLRAHDKMCGKQRNEAGSYKAVEA